MRARITIILTLTAITLLGACGSDNKAVKVVPGAGGARTCNAPAASGKPTVGLPSTPATKLGITDNKVGSGAVINEHATVTVQYVGCGQISGKQFDASWDRGQPAEFNIDEVIPGWTQGLLGMKIGGRRTLVIPGAMAYGTNPPSADIKPNETLVFVVDLISIAPPVVTTTTTPADPAVVAAIAKRGKPTVTVPAAPATALKIVDNVVGTGATVAAHSTITAQYVGYGQISKKQFDASWDRGAPLTISIDGVIPGWTKGLPGMKVGGRRTLIIPGALAYGPNPPSNDIQPNETLVFVIDLIAVS